jgi:putative hemolysin
MNDVTLLPLLILFLVTLACSALFSATEAAFLSVQRYKVRSLANRGVAGAQRVAKLAGHPEQFLPTILVGNNIANTAAATLGTLIAIEVFSNEGAGAVVAAAVVAVVLIVFGETIPKTLGTQRAETAAILLARPLEWVERILWPVAYPLQLLNTWVADRAGRSSSVVSQEEFKVLISLNKESGSIDETQADVLLRTLRLTELQVRDVMTQRSEISWIPDTMKVSEFLEFNSLQYHSRFPVCRDGVDGVVGILNARDVLRSLGTSVISASDPVSQLMEPTYFLWESKPALEAVAEMRRQKLEMALAVDEFGSVVGLVTIHSMLSEVVGRGHEERSQQALRAADGQGYTLKGVTRIYEVNDLFGVGLPDGDYDTVAGFMMNRLGRVPRPGDKVAHRDWEFTVARARGPRVDEVRLMRSQPPERRAA